MIPPAVQNREATDAELEALVCDLLVLVDVARRHWRNHLRLRRAQARGRCVGVTDLARACEALEKHRRALETFSVVAKRAAALLDARRGDALTTIEREVLRSLDSVRGDVAE